MKKITLLFTLLITILGFSQELLTNGDFESGATGWVGNAFNVVTQNDNSFNEANVIAAGNPWDVNLSQILALTEGTEYVLKFDAWSDADRTIIAGIGLNEGPWTNVTETVNLTMESTPFEYTFIANFGSTNSRVIFDMGADTGYVGIDNVSLMAVQSAAPTCSDGIQNGDEAGIDCGGSCDNECKSQIDLPLTFQDDTVDLTMTPFGNTGYEVVADPENPENTVIKVVKPETAEFWGGTTIGTAAGFATALPVTTTDSKMYVRVWVPNAGTPIRLKIEDASDPTKSVETEVNTTMSSTWETLEFDFNNEVPGTAALNPSYTFNKASIFFNFVVPASNQRTLNPNQDQEFYFDDVAFSTPIVLSIDTFTSDDFKVFPNPTTSVWNVKTNNETITSIKVYDVLGKQVLVSSPNSVGASIDASGLKKGIYFANINSNKGSASIKLVKN